MKPVLFGLDGADPELIDKWIDDLPGFQRLKEQGAYGSLESIEPPITVPAWHCMIAGTEPDTYGVYDFKTVNKETYEQDFIHSSTFEDTPLNQEDTLSFRVPGTTPAYHDNCIAGFVLSEDLEIDEETRQAMEDDGLDLERSSLDDEKRENSLANFEKNIDAFIWLLEQRDWKQAYSVFRAIDVWMHHSDSEDDMKRVYKAADKALQRILDKADEHGWTIIVASDHGSQETEQKWYLNTWLEQQGYLVRRKESKSVKKHLMRKSASIITKLGLKKPVKRLASVLQTTTGTNIKPSGETLLAEMEPEKTEAFCYISGITTYGVIWINDDRFSNGPVINTEEKAKEIVEKLEEEPWVEQATRPWENRDMPDILIEADPNTVVGSEHYPDQFHTTKAIVHGKEGLIAAYGNDIPDKTSLNAYLPDVGATIQHWIGEETPNGTIIEALDTE